MGVNNIRNKVATLCADLFIPEPELYQLNTPIPDVVHTFVDETLHTMAHSNA